MQTTTARPCRPSVTCMGARAAIVWVAACSARATKGAGTSPSPPNSRASSLRSSAPWPRTSYQDSPWTAQVALTSSRTPTAAWYRYSSLLTKRPSHPTTHGDMRANSDNRDSERGYCLASRLAERRLPSSSINPPIHPRLQTFPRRLWQSINTYTRRLSLPACCLCVGFLVVPIEFRSSVAIRPSATLTGSSSGSRDLSRSLCRPRTWWAT
mmetsp:Transcript_27034/g.77718  ORF Transcript_27034/g.77718 Transcript_27034/m.77718 type:complete len:211 (+) Transcript_27034:644-1276(+)